MYISYILIIFISAMPRLQLYSYLVKYQILCGGIMSEGIFAFDTESRFIQQNLAKDDEYNGGIYY